MSEIKGKGIPTRQTVGALGDIYTDTNTGVKYKCTGAYAMSTHAGTSKEYEWKPANPVFKNMQRTAEDKPHETPKKQPKAKAKAAEKVVEPKVEEPVVEKVEEPKPEAPVKKEKVNTNQHNYTKHFDDAKKAE